MEAEVAQGVETVVDAEFFVGEAVVVVNQGAERLNSLTAAGWIRRRRVPVPSRMAVLTQLTLSRIFQGERGVETLRPDLRRMAWSVRPTPAVLRAAPVGSGQTSLRRSRPKRWLISSATSQVVALVMISSSKMWRSSPTRTPKTADMLSTLKSRPIQRGSLGDVFYGFGDVFVGEVDGDESGEVLEARLKFLAECSWVKLCTCSLHLLWWDVSPLDGGVGPAFPVIVVFTGEAP